MEREVDETDDAHLLNSVGADEAAGAGTTLPRTARRDGVTFYQLFWLAELWPDMHNTPDGRTLYDEVDEVHAECGWCVSR